MTDQPTPTPGTESEPKKTKRPRADIRQDYLDELTLSEAIVTAAEKPDYAPSLTAEGCDAAKVAELKTKIAAARALITSVGAKSTARKGVTKTEEQLQSALVVLVGKVQSRAKAVYDRGDLRRKNYFIGEAIDNSRARLEQTSLDVLTHATSDTQLAAPAELLASLAAARDAYVGVQGEQTDRQTDSSTAREQLDQAIRDVAALRRKVQYAADGAWPALGRKHTPIRREFKIPADRKLQ